MEVEITENTPVRHEVHMTSVVATYWYERFSEFKKQNPVTFGEITFAEYLGEQVLTSLMLLFKGTEEARSELVEFEEDKEEV